MAVTQAASCRWHRSRHGWLRPRGMYIQCAKHLPLQCQWLLSCSLFNGLHGRVLQRTLGALQLSFGSTLPPSSAIAAFTSSRKC